MRLYDVQIMDVRADDAVQVTVYDYFATLKFQLETGTVVLFGQHPEKNTDDGFQKHTYADETLQAISLANLEGLLEKALEKVREAAAESRILS